MYKTYHIHKSAVSQLCEIPDESDFYARKESSRKLDKFKIKIKIGIINEV